MRNNIGGFVEMEGFLSTTLNQEITLNYQPDVIVQISINKNNLGDELDNGFAYLNLDDCSNYSN